MNYCKLIKKQQKLKNKDCVGINWNTVGIILGILVSVFIISLVVGFNSYEFIKNKYNNYLIDKSIKYESESMEQQSIIDESIIQSIEQQNIINESIKQSIKQQEELQQRKEQVEYENKIIKKQVPYGTWVRNKDLNNKVGKVISYQGNRIFTDTEWWFDLNKDLSYPDNVKTISQIEYLKGLDILQKSKDKETRELAESLMAKEQLDNTNYTKSLFKMNNGYDKYYFKCNGKYYRVKKIVGLNIYTKEGKVFNSKLDKIQEVPWIEYDRSLVGNN